VNAVTGTVRVARFSLSALATILLVLAAPRVYAEELVNPEGALFNESAPLDDQGLAEVHGTGGAVTPSQHPRNDVAVILWDEQPKNKPVPVAPNDTSASQAVNTSIRSR